MSNSIAIKNFNVYANNTGDTVVASFGILKDATTFARLLSEGTGSGTHVERVSDRDVVAVF